MPEKIEKFVTPGPLPTARERDILVILIKECAEVQQRAAKAAPRLCRNLMPTGSPKRYGQSRLPLTEACR